MTPPPDDADDARRRADASSGAGAGAFDTRDGHAGSGGDDDPFGALGSHDFGPPPDFHGVPDVEFDGPPVGLDDDVFDVGPPPGHGSGSGGGSGSGRSDGGGGFGGGGGRDRGGSGGGSRGGGPDWRSNDARGLAERLSAARRPPQSVEAEQSLLGGLMLTGGEAFERVAEVVTEDDFYQENNRLLFRAVSTLVEGGNNADIVTVTEWLRERGLLERADGLAYADELTRYAPSASNIKAYAEIVRERSVLRQLIAVANEIADSAFESEGRPSKDLLDEAETRVFAIADQSAKSGAGFQDIKGVLAGAIDKITYLFESDAAVTGLETGFKDLDEMTSGLQKSDLVIVAGRPSMGKTTFAMNLVENVAMTNDLPVAVFSMEMPAEQLALRLISSLGRVELQKIRTGKLQEQDWPRITSAITMLNKQRNIYIDDTPAMTPTDLRARCRRLAREHGLSLIVIDYLQLMQLANSKENRATEISEISRSLKALAKELQVPVVALSQLNRSLEQRPDKRPVMSDLRECVAGDTRVALADGRQVPIRELVGQTPEVVSMRPDGKLGTAPAELVWSVGERPTFDVVTAGGRRLRCTAEHRVRALEGWKRVAELGVGDRLALPRTLPTVVDPIDAPEHEIVLLAHLIGDGSYVNHQPLRYTTASESNSEAVRAAAEAMGSTVRRVAYKDTWHQLVIAGNGNRWHPAGVGKWLKGLGIWDTRSHDKAVPDFVFRLPNERLALFLRHLWATDGSVHVSEGHHPRLYFATCSRQLIDDVCALLTRFGIVGRIKRLTPKGSGGWYTLDVSGNEQQLRYAREVGAFGDQEEKLARLVAQIEGKLGNTNVDSIPIEVFDRVRARMVERGISHVELGILRGTAYGSASAYFRHAPSRELLGEYAELLECGDLAKIASSDLFWDRVVSIDPAGTEEVFDLTVPAHASWVSSMTISHNSGAIEQDADVIMFVYRDEVYHPENEESHGRAEILIRKQRNGPIGAVNLTFLGKFVRFEDFSPEIRGAEFE